MGKIIQTIIGLAMIGTDIFLLIKGHGEHSEWFHLVLLGGGGFFISQTVMTNLLKTAVDTAKQLLPKKSAE